MSISAFWQLYDAVIPKILQNTFGFGETVTGAIMAADNVIALFLLPLLGAVSDKVDTRIGKRMPFIMGGTAAAVLSMLFLPIIDNAYYATSNAVLKYIFIGVLLFVLIAMATYRSPAVALMPDLTEKPNRSKANAIINLMGTVGGIVYLCVSAVLLSKNRIGGLDHVDYLPTFIVIAIIMVTAAVLLFVTVKEKKIASEVKAYENEHPEENLAVVVDGKEKLPKDVKKSLVLVLVSISLWFAGYNAVATAFTRYAEKEWGMVDGDASTCLLIATAFAVVSFIPIGIVSSKIGRKRTILIGIVVLSTSFAAAAVYSMFTHAFSPVLYVIFMLVGVSWAAINVNSLPMVVEMCKCSDVGKYTGLYYTFSMFSQIITPILSGALLQYVGYWTLFPYSALFVALSFVTMLFVRHGDNKPKAVKGIEAFDVED